jgi:hypothetical protein
MRGSDSGDRFQITGYSQQFTATSSGRGREVGLLSRQLWVWAWLQSGGFKGGIFWSEWLAEIGAFGAERRAETVAMARNAGVDTDKKREK